MISTIRLSIICILSIVVSPASADDYSVITMEKSLQRNGTSYDSHQGFQEKIDFYTGRLFLSQIDFAFPGNGPDIIVERKLTSASFPGPIGAWEFDWRSINSMADWELVAPHLEVILPFESYANGQPPVGYKYARTAQWKVSAADLKSRCSNYASIPNYTISTPIVATVEPHHWWTGLKMELPGRDSQEVLVRASENNIVPTMAINGGVKTFNLVTNKNWMITCLSELKNPEYGGEGFLAVDTDGVKYFFDWMAFKGISVIGTAYKSGNAWPTLPIWGTKALLLATRVEDRFGNYVNYSYEGERLVSAVASDGRQIEFQWAEKPWGPADPVRGFTSDGFHHLASFTVQPRTQSARTWSYEYQLIQYGNKARRDTRLRRMVQPDGSSWTYSLDNIVSGCFYILSNSTMNYDCQKTQPYTSSVTAPSGATTTYTFQTGIKQRYLQNPQAEQQIFDRNEIAAYILTSKRIAGPGVDYAWTYSVSGNGTPISYHTTLHPNGARSVQMTDATHRSTTEGQVLWSQLFQNPSDTLALRSQSYEYAPATGQSYPAKIGSNVQRWGASNLEVHRPLRKSVIVQEGVRFTKEVLEFDQLGRERTIKSTSVVPQ